MNVVFLTTNDPLYLPQLFERVLSERSSAVRVFVVPPLYKAQTTLGAARRYIRTFGLRAGWNLARRTATAKLRKQSIATMCARYGVPAEAIDDVNAPSFLNRLHRLETDVIVSVSCPQIFRRQLLELPRKGCVNVHGAILPHYRGIMPSFWMMARREQRAGVSAFFVNEDVDAGDLCGQRIFPMRPAETLDAFLKRSKAAAAELILEVLADIEAGTVRRRPVDLAEGSYFSWPDREAVRQFHAAGRRLW
jgi:methionyl-tRNA formyltransferase